jgi:hypothetical protein
MDPMRTEQPSGAASLAGKDITPGTRPRVSDCTFPIARSVGTNKRKTLGIAPRRPIQSLVGGFGLKVMLPKRPAPTKHGRAKEFCPDASREVIRYCLISSGARGKSASVSSPEASSAAVSSEQGFPNHNSLCCD